MAVYSKRVLQNESTPPALLVNPKLLLQKKSRAASIPINSKHALQEESIPKPVKRYKSTASTSAACIAYPRIYQSTCISEEQQKSSALTSKLSASNATAAATFVPSPRPFINAPIETITSEIEIEPSTCSPVLLEILQRIETNIFKITRDLSKLKKNSISQKISNFEEFSYSDHFPIESEEELLEMEKKLSDPAFTTFLTATLRRNTPKSEEKFIPYLKNIIKPTLLANYNWEGRSNKKALCSFVLFYKCLREATNFDGYQYEKCMRNAIRSCHHIMYVKKSKIKTEELRNLPKI